MLRFDISISLDGFVAGPNQSERHPLGEGGEELHEWALGLEAWRAPHGKEGGEVNASSAVLEESQEGLGATIMGRNMFGGSGAWEKHPWDGWWGDEPPFKMPVFVLTHHPRKPLEMNNDTVFTFVTEGPEVALGLAREAAGDDDVGLSGGAQAAQQYLRAGLIDEMQLHLVPVLLGGGVRLFEGLGDDLPELECVRVVKAPGVTHLKYRAAG